ncbi:MAG: RIP metalloprotease RseP [Bdellovibrionaceae bacterium]|nr:RIP metalloprotease RseP [Pseudobdellovibrionaceae bacterium]
MDIILNYLHSGFTQIFSFIVLLGVLVFVHELGHFLVARWCGVRVEVFSLGFGKKIFQYTKDGTNYCISIIPLGGYVKMFGEQPGETIPDAEKPFSFSHKKVSQRMAVVLAGPLMNLFFAFLIFMIVSSLGELVKGPVMGEIQPSSIAEKAGFKAGDRIISVNSQNITTWDGFQNALDRNLDSTVHVVVEREHTKQMATLDVPVKSKKNPNVVSSKKTIGDVEGINLFSYAAIVGVMPTSPLAKAGLLTGDRIVKINDIDVVNFRDVEPALNKLYNNPDSTQPTELKIKIVRNEIDSKNKIEKDLVVVGIDTAKRVTLESLKIDSTQLFIDRVMPDSPAQVAGILKGDRIISINDKKLVVWEDILTNVKSFSGEGKLSVLVRRGEELVRMDVVPNMTTHMTPHGTEEKRFTIGISPFLMYAPPETVLLKYSDIGSILRHSADKTWEVSVMTLLSFVKLIQNELSPKNIGGIFSIAQAANETFKIGLVAFLQMMALISINLFILNLLPVPILDGGHLVFYTIEAIKGSPLSMSKIELAHKVGMILLFSLMVFALFNDFRRMLGFM